jgi:cation:H+ antiporter
MSNYIFLLLGVLAAGAGGELFVRGSVGLARWARVAPGLVGATVAAFATSSPELAVAVNAAAAGRPQISLGDVLGSSIVNVALILGLALSISSIRSSRDSIRRDFPCALLLPAMAALLLIDGTISRMDGFILLVLFAVWLVAVVREARKQRSENNSSEGPRRIAFALTCCLLGLPLLFLAGYLIVNGARGIASAYGVNEFIIGATIVAVGTSVPELATTLISKLRGHDDLGMGTVFGSNIFNSLFIVGVAALICPIDVPLREVAASLIFGVLTVALTYPDGQGTISRTRGILLLGSYVAYLLVTIWGHLGE